jgi:hypothetical protein
MKGSPPQEQRPSAVAVSRGTEFWTFQSDDLASAAAIHQHQFVDLLRISKLAK